MAKRPLENESIEPDDQETQEFGEFKLGGKIAWADDKTKEAFNKPAFGYGFGPFEIVSIKIVKAANPEPSKRPFMNNVMLTISTPKGEKSLSADYFIAV